jgi:hypothetical protein
MILGLCGQSIFAYRNTKGELALRVGCDPDGGTSRLSGSARFHLSALQNLAVLVEHAARKQDAGWHDQIAEILRIARGQHEKLASQGQLVGR